VGISWLAASTRGWSEGDCWRMTLWRALLRSCGTKRTSGSGAWRRRGRGARSAAPDPHRGPRWSCGRGLACANRAGAILLADNWRGRARGRGGLSPSSAGPIGARLRLQRPSHGRLHIQLPGTRPFQASGPCSFPNVVASGDRHRLYDSWRLAQAHHALEGKIMPRTRDAHQRLAQGYRGALWPRSLNRPLSSAGEQEAGPEQTRLASAER
jgi:hypothetical protein